MKTILKEQQHIDSHNSSKLHFFRTFSDGSIEYNQGTESPKAGEGVYHFYQWQPLWADCPYWSYYQAPITNPAHAGQVAKRLAKAAIHRARRQARKAYFTHRDVELVPCAKSGDMCENSSVEYIALTELSGRAIRQAVERFAELHPDLHSVNFYGGFNEYQSMQVFFHHPDDYEISIEPWDFELFVVTEGSTK
jgi:hypothetical protein